ncbi:MAG: hypothetical protein QOH18_1254 [Solirubrobacterales bacterium]|jgi:hypothetical protein|nr:hypothetical protein [Solirubrobacterales bacterium]
MRFFWDERRFERLETKVDRLESKMDGGFAGTRSEITAARSDARGDFRLLLGVLLAMFMAMILGFAGIMVTILLQLN